MELIARLGSLLGLSFVSGINLYATVAVAGICSKYHLVQGLPAEFDALAHDGVIAVAVILYLVEFLMDKIPGLDTLWDSIHTFIRPLGGAMLALMQVGEASPALQVIVFMLGASLASVAHFTKAATRLVINASPEPFSNIVVSVIEDVGAIGLSYLSLAYPRLSLLVTLGLLALFSFFLPLLIRSMRMLLGALVFKLRCWIQGDFARDRFEQLPMAYDQFFAGLRGPDDTTLWTGYGYAGKVPGIPKFAAVRMVVSNNGLLLLYRRRLQLKVQKLAAAQILEYKFYPGRLLTRWLLRTPNGSWLVALYQPLTSNLKAKLTQMDAAEDRSG